MIAYGDPVTVNFPMARVSIACSGCAVQYQSGFQSETLRKIKVNLPFVKRNGQSISFEIAHIYTGTLPVLINQVIDLTVLLFI